MAVANLLPCKHMRTFTAFMLAVILGSIIGLYGVIVSVFADGPLDERIITISTIILVYIVVSFFFGYLFPELGWRLGILFGFPGALFLAFYTVNETNPLYFLYILLIILVACLFTGVGSNMKTRKDTL